MERILLIALMMYFLMQINTSLNKLDQQGINLKHSNLKEKFPFTLNLSLNHINRYWLKVGPTLGQLTGPPFYRAAYCRMLKF